MFWDSPSLAWNGVVERVSAQNKYPICFATSVCSRGSSHNQENLCMVLCYVSIATFSRQGGSESDYCNELSVGLSLKSTWKLQFLQKAAVQAVMGTS